MKVHTCLVALSLLSVLSLNNQPAAAFRSSLQTAGEPRPSDAIEGVVKAFDKFPIVALSEAHGLPEEVKRDFETVLKMKFFDPLKSSLLEKDGSRGGKVITFLLSEK